MRFTAIITLLGVAPCLGVAADSAAGWDDLRRELAADPFSGVVLVARGETILFQEGFGLANRAKSEPITPDTAFRIGSLTKALTAAAVADLVAEGRMTLQTPAGKDWPEWPAAWAEVTVESLLLHTAGLPEYTDRLDFPTAWMPAISPAALFRQLGSEPRTAGAASHSAYSNTHYVLLGALIERATGQPYADYLAARIFRPAAMTRTRLWPTGEPRPRHASGYPGVEDTNPVDERPPELLAAAGGLSSTAGDLHRFLRWLAVRSAVPWSIPARPPVAGWTELRLDGRPAWACVGQVRGFAGAMLVQPDAGWSVVVLSNVDRAPVTAWALRAREIAATRK